MLDCLSNASRSFEMQYLATWPEDSIRFNRLGIEILVTSTCGIPIFSLSGFPGFRREERSMG